MKDTTTSRKLQYAPQSQPDRGTAKLISNALLILSLCSVLLGAFPAVAQVENLIQINTLLPSEAGGCYPGTAGVDATMFIRLAPGLSQCDQSDPFNNLCLARREFPADGANGTAISFYDMALLRPSLAGDGSFVMFVNNLDLCVMASNQNGQEACYNLPGPNGYYVHGIAVQPQAVLLGLVPRDLNNINVPANAIHIFQLGPFPSLTLLTTFQFTSPVIFPETVDFMTRGLWMVFDASTTAVPGGQWGLFLINLNTGELRSLAPAVAGYELRNPVFGQTSDDVITFEAVSTTSAQSTVLTANLLTGDVRKIADINLAAAIPTFNGDDTKIIFNREDGAVFSSASLRERALLADRITPNGPEQSHLLDGAFATIYRRGTFDTTSTACPEPTLTIGLSILVLGLTILARRRSAIRGDFGLGRPTRAGENR